MKLSVQHHILGPKKKQLHCCLSSNCWTIIGHHQVKYQIINIQNLGLNFAIASKSPVSATTTVPEAFSCSREVIAVFFGSGWDILAYNTDLQQAFNMYVAFNSKSEMKQGCWKFQSFISDDLKIFSQPFERPELYSVARGWIGRFWKYIRALVLRCTHGDT